MDRTVNRGGVTIIITSLAIKGDSHSNRVERHYPDNYNGLILQYLSLRANEGKGVVVPTRIQTLLTCNFENFERRKLTVTIIAANSDSDSDLKRSKK